MIAALIAASMSFSAAAQEEPKVQVLILGVYHFHNPGADLVKAELDDHLSPKRQKEIEEVAALLQEFQPTKIAVERPYGDERPNEQYRDYLAGKYTLTANETDQLGMRLAKELGHSRLYPFDYRMGMDFGKLISFAQENGDTEFLGYMTQMQEYIKQTVMDPLNTRTVRENLLFLNNPALMKLGTSPYLRMARLGKDDQYPGAEVVAGWYERNIKMYANLWRFAEPGDRVLVIVGSGHAPILRQFVKDTDEMELLEAIHFLNPAPGTST